jgi:hypothetical protein
MQQSCSSPTWRSIERAGMKFIIQHADRLQENEQLRQLLANSDN